MQTYGLVDADSHVVIGIGQGSDLVCVSCVVCIGFRKLAGKLWSK